MKAVGQHIKNLMVKTAVALCCAILLGVFSCSGPSPTPISFPPIAEFLVFVTPTPPPPTTVDVASAVTPQGVFTQSVVTKLTDTRPTEPVREVTLAIPKDTKGTTREGTPVSQITMAQTVAPAAAPAGSNMIGVPVDFGPSGTSFSQPVTVTVTFDVALLPPGTDPNNLVFAFWDTGASMWVELPGKVDVATGKMTAEVLHFTVFAVLTSISAPTLILPSESALPAIKPTAPPIYEGAPGVEILAPVEGDVNSSYSLQVLVAYKNFSTMNLSGPIVNWPNAGRGVCYLDVEPPTKKGQSALTAKGTYVFAGPLNNIFIWTYVARGKHTIYVQLVNYDNTSLDPPVVAKVTFTIAY